MCGGYREPIAQELSRLGFCVDMQDLKSTLWHGSMGKRTRRQKLFNLLNAGTRECRRMMGVVFLPLSRMMLISGFGISQGTGMTSHDNEKLETV